MTEHDVLLYRRAGNWILLEKINMNAFYASWLFSFIEGLFNPIFIKSAFNTCIRIAYRYIYFLFSLFRLDCTAYRCTLCHPCGDYFGARSGMCCVWGWTQHCTTSISSALVPCSSLCSSSCYPPHCSITLSLQPWVSIFAICIACKYSFGVELKKESFLLLGFS